MVVDRHGKYHHGTWDLVSGGLPITEAAHLRTAAIFLQTGHLNCVTHIESSHNTFPDPLANSLATKFTAGCEFDPISIALPFDVAQC